VTCTCLWWSVDGPDIEPFAEVQDMLEVWRAELLALRPTLVVPGHGRPFRPA
jgi:glyoxylase-like metal-dependent hydrolase (beta-lactamase superfamily II)